MILFQEDIVEIFVGLVNSIVRGRRLTTRQMSPVYSTLCR